MATAVADLLLNPVFLITGGPVLLLVLFVALCEWTRVQPPWAPGQHRRTAWTLMTFRRTSARFLTEHLRVEREKREADAAHWAAWEDLLTTSAGRHREEHEQPRRRYAVVTSDRYGPGATRYVELAQL